ncbi:DUF4230 domain-containing protein [Sphingomonas sp. BIUV-7]|uniref:DUF4230 domain-containing protein n=1 Tax=Sphingomonas natans TaxID=3063330 RepID=A0ABT8YB17_9SPHN|nr:DUF4230 domain-containing protein [Sphingomonas sp. BIUV-7]MDO6415510.1 DUF4230 domain-containing protein [Sphingomonas sp. BIUV-7]
MRPVLRAVGGAILIAGIVGLLYVGVGWRLRHMFESDPSTVARASLQAVRQQNRLVPFAARFVAVVTAEESKFGFSARKTLIMPGLVRYSIDLAKLRDRDLTWNGATRTLTVTLPPIELEGPEVDLTAIREYGQGGVLMTLTDAEKELDAANRKAGQAELVAQAHDALPMRLAADAARMAIERSFAMPLKAAGANATVVARFRDDPR